MDEEMKTIENIGKKVSGAIEFLNSGGCAIYVLALYRYLKNNGKLKGNEKFVYLYMDSFTYKTNDDYLKNKSNNPAACFHAALMYNNQLIDCNGLIRDYYSQKHFIPIEKEKDFLLKSINEGSWNCLFNREIGVKRMESILKVELNDVEI